VLRRGAIRRLRVLLSRPGTSRRTATRVLLVRIERLVVARVCIVWRLHTIHVLGERISVS